MPPNAHIDTRGRNILDLIQQSIEQATEEEDRRASEELLTHVQTLHGMTRIRANRNDDDK